MQRLKSKRQIKFGNDDELRKFRKDSQWNEERWNVQTSPNRWLGWMQGSAVRQSCCRRWKAEVHADVLKTSGFSCLSTLNTPTWRTQTYIHCDLHFPGLYLHGTLQTGIHRSFKQLKLEFYRKTWTARVLHHSCLTSLMNLDRKTFHF